MRGRDLSGGLEEVRELTRQVSRARAFQAEDIARAKALWWVCARQAEEQ